MPTKAYTENKIIQDLTKQVEDLKAQVASEKSSKDYYYRMYNDVQQQLRELNSFLDLLPNAPAQKSTGDFPADLSVTTRLAIWFANKA